MAVVLNALTCGDGKCEYNENVSTTSEYNVSGSGITAGQTYTHGEYNN